MAIPSPAERSGSEIITEPNQYAPGDLVSLTGAPELQGATMDGHDAPAVLSAMFTLGRVSLYHGNEAAYAGWTAQAGTLVDELATRPEPVVSGRLHDSVTGLLFLGAVAGQTVAYEKLLERLKPSAAKAGQPLKTVMGLCAKYNLNPDSLIEQYTARAEHQPDARAEAWGRYLSAKHFQAEQSLAPEILNEPGWERFFYNSISGELSADVLLKWGITVYRAAADQYGKRQITRSYSLAMGGLSSWPVNDVSLHAVMAFATELIVDPAMPHESTEKIDMMTQAMRVALLGSDESIQARPRAVFELAVAIEDGEGVVELLAKIETMAGRQEPDNRRGVREQLIRRASEFYTTTGQAERAAAMLAHIDSTDIWEKEIRHYARAGGDLSLALHADAMRQVSDDMVEPLPVAEPQWAVRELIAQFLMHLRPQSQNLSQAEATLLNMAKSAGRQDADTIPGHAFNRYARNLLAVDAGALALGPQAINHLTAVKRTDSVRSVYELFAAYGSAEMAAAGWQAMRDYPPRTRVTYFSRYARLTLASAGLLD